MSNKGDGEKMRTMEHPNVKGAIRGDVVSIDRSAVGLIQAERAELHLAGAGVVFASKDVAIERGAAREIVAGGPLRLTQGGAGMILAGGDTSIRQSGTGTLVSLGRTEIEQGGAALLVASSASVGRGGVVVFAITSRLDVAEGGRVLGGPMAAIAAIVMAILGAILIRRR